MTKTQARISGQQDVERGEGLGLKFFVNRDGFLLRFVAAVIFLFVVVTSFDQIFFASFVAAFDLAISHIQFGIDPPQIQPVVICFVPIDMINVLQDIRTQIFHKTLGDKTMNLPV